jgi:hypothetical protein
LTSNFSVALSIKNDLPAPVNPKTRMTGTTAVSIGGSLIAHSEVTGGKDFEGRNSCCLVKDQLSGEIPHSIGQKIRSLSSLLRRHKVTIGTLQNRQT